MSVPAMPSDALLEIMGAVQNYLVEETMDFDPPGHLNVQDRLLASGLEMHEAERMLTHAGRISRFLSELSEDLEIFKKVATFREDRAKKTELLERKKELAETRARSVSLEANIAETRALSVSLEAEIAYLEKCL